MHKPILVFLAVVEFFGISQGELDLSPEWEDYTMRFSKEYASSTHQKRHQATYNARIAQVELCNANYQAGNQNYWCGVNQYSDYDESQLRESLLRPMSFDLKTHGQKLELLSETPPATADWRTTGAVSSVKNQGTCGSCWAFSAVGALESQYFIETGVLRNLSEQQLLDCSGYLGNEGCKGGNIEKAFEYIVENKGVDDFKDYPYSGLDGFPCDRNRSERHVAEMFNFTTLQPNSEDQLAAAVGLYGPVSVAIQANEPSFLQYKGGVFDDEKCGTQLDHGVLVVGYTKDYWIVKNSWGEAWGEKGYIRMKRGVGTKGICGIASYPSFPRVHHGKALPVPDPTPSPPPALPCSCAPSCQKMCVQFGMRCCSGVGGNCNCQPPRDTCCTKTDSWATQE